MPLVVRRRERGQALPLLAGLLVVAAAVALVLGELGAAAVQRARARTAADAAALAGAAEGEAAARDVAADNGAALLSFVADGDTVRVVVRHGDARASASAAAVRVGGDARGFAPALAAAVQRAEELLGRPVDVAAVDADGLGFTAAADGASSLIAVAAQAGLCRPSPTVHPVHFAPCPPNSPG